MSTCFLFVGSHFKAADTWRDGEGGSEGGRREGESGCEYVVDGTAAGASERVAGWEACGGNGTKAALSRGGAARLS